MADSSNDSSCSGGDCGGVRLSDHSPSAPASYLYQTTPSSSSNTIRGSHNSPADVFGPELSSRPPQLHVQGRQQNYQLPQPPKLHPDYRFSVQGSSQQAGPPNAQYTSSSSAGRASFRSGGAVVATPTSRSLIEATSAGRRSGTAEYTPSREFKPSSVNSANTSGTISSDTRRAQSALETISEEQGKNLEFYGSVQPKKISGGMSAHCQLEGPLAGPLRDSRRSELARGHPAWVKARQVQAGIMTTQQAIRRTPGIPSNIANDLCDGLQKYAQEVNNMLRQAINEVSDHQIDLDYNNKVLCSNKLETNIILEEREQLKREIRDLQSKYDELEDRLARYHVENENHKNAVREYLAKIDHKDDQDNIDEIMKRLLEILKEFMTRPSSRWLHGERENGLQTNPVTSLSAASIAALEQQENRPPKPPQPSEQQLVSTRPVLPSNSYENNALQPFNYQQSTDQSQMPVANFTPAQNGPSSAYPGMFNNARRPTDSRTMSSAGWTRPSNVVHAQPSMPPVRPFSRAGDPRNGFTNGFDGAGGAGGFGNQYVMQARPGTAMGNRGFHSQSTSFRPNAPEFHPGSFDNTDASYNFSYGHASNTGSRRDFNGYNGSLTSPTPRAASRAGFGNFEGPSSGYNLPSPLLPQTPGFGHNQHYSGTPDSVIRQKRNHGNTSSGQNYHTANHTQGGFTPGPIDQGRNGARSESNGANGGTSFGPGTGFSQDDGGDNERYARAFEGVLRFASSIDPGVMSHLSEISLVHYMTTLYAPFSEQQAWSYIRQHLNDGMARSCLISRAIIDLLIHRIFVFEAWQGFSVDADRQIGEIRHEMRNLPAGQGGTLQVCVDRVAVIVNSCINHERYEAYRSHRIEYFQSELREMLAPILLDESDGGPNLEEADDALRNMIEKAWAISAKMFTSRSTFEFRLPEAGARFSTQTMVAIAPNIDPYVLQAEHWRVQLVITPVITVRNDTGATISVASITNAHVICMK
ncbi:hypothetical protein CPLU01_01172 [Colletotrichum plurivorum]|uniref:Uncharacterized protein n=1 Tax=Colletotrichum plurivorum TaxID=2175906 RepID=A0A8H6U514_9PEZI|nr:hypothetical protein CPLU01_01172 [Colletotrichum plurivorum]